MTYSPRVADQLRGQSPMAGLDRRNLGPMQVFAQSVSGAAPAAAMAVIPAIVAANAGSATIWSLAIATGLALLVAGCIGQFTRRMAAAGSLYSLTAKGLGPGPALLCGTGLMVGYSLLGMGSLTGAAMQTAALLARLGLPGSGSPAAAVVLVVLLAGLVAACTVRGVRLSAGVVLLVEALSITLMLVVFGVLLVSHGIAPDTRQLSPSAGPGVGGVVAGVLPALGAFIGFEAAAAMGVEARRPFRTIPRAVRSTAALTGVLSLLAAYTQVAGFATVPDGLAGQTEPVRTLAAGEQLPWLSALLDVGLATSFLACAVATTTSLARLLFTMGREGVLPPVLGAAHRRFRTPHVAIAVALPVLAVVPVLLFATGLTPARALVPLLVTAALGYLLAYLLVCLAAPVFLHRIGELTAGAVLATSVIVPVLLVVLAAFLSTAPVSVAALVTVAVLLLAGARYLWLRARHPERLAAVGAYDETSAADLLGTPPLHWTAPLRRPVATAAPDQPAVAPEPGAAPEPDR
ncbi:MAG TPA: APC family permease [Pseudonocardia sp.]|nr:APC family permease [Pseudonocardia sp.]